MDVLEIRRWNVAALDQLEQSLSARAVMLAEVQDRLTDLGRLPAWHGDAADAARVRIQALIDGLVDEVARVGAIRGVLRETREGVAQVKKELDRIGDFAGDNGLVMSEFGEIVDLSGDFANTAEGFANTDEGFANTAEGFANTAEGLIRERMCAELRRVVRVLLEQAENIDAAAASVLSRAASGEIDGRDVPGRDTTGAQGEPPGESRAPTPLRESSASENRAYWDALDEAQRREVIERHPEWVGSLDGIPAEVRDEANVKRIGAERSRLESERDRLRNELGSTVFGGIFTSADARLWYVEQKLNDLDVVENIVDEHPEALLLLLDMQSGERGMAAFSLGNPDTADHIAVTVPGINSNIGETMAAMVGEASLLRGETLHQLDRAGRVGERAATIAYLGFEPPQTSGPGYLEIVRGSMEVASADRAADGAGHLSKFLAGLEVASQKEDPHLTLLGHSYGSLTAGLTLQEPGGSPVDDVVFYGSPGVGAGSEAELGLEPGHVYAMEADDDWFVPEVGKTGYFGPDPSDIFPNLSVEEGVSPDGVDREAAHGHAEYARPDVHGKSRMSGYNLAVVVAGLPNLVVR